VAGEASDATDRAASILRDTLDVWATEGRRLYDRSAEKPMWSPEDIVGDTTDLTEHLTPLVEQSINLWLELLRPWAQAFQARSTAGGDGGPPPGADIDPDLSRGGGSVA
jgi:hypothetical protein